MRPRRARLARIALKTRCSVWDVRTGAKRASLGPVTQVEFSPADIALIVGPGYSHLWNLKSAKDLGEAPLFVDVHFSRDGRRMIGFIPDGRRLWNLDTGKQIADFAPGPAEFSGDGKWVMSRSIEGQKVTAWDAETGQKLIEVGRGFEAYFSANPALVLVSADKQLTVWDLRSSIKNPFGLVSGVQVSSRGDIAITEAADGRALPGMLPSQFWTKAPHPTIFKRREPSAKRAVTRSGHSRPTIALKMARKLIPTETHPRFIKLCAVDLGTRAIGRAL